MGGIRSPQFVPSIQSPSRRSCSQYKRNSSQSKGDICPDSSFTRRQKVRSQRYSRLIFDLSPDNDGEIKILLLWEHVRAENHAELADGLGPLRYSIQSILESGRRVVTGRDFFTTFHDARTGRRARVSSFLSQGNRIIPRIRYHGRCLGSFATVGERDDLHTFSTGGNEIAREAKMAKPLFPPYLKRTLAIRRRNKMYATYRADVVYCAFQPRAVTFRK